MSREDQETWIEGFFLAQDRKKSKEQLEAVSRGGTMEDIENEERERQYIESVFAYERR